MPTPAQRQHFVKRLEVARSELAAERDPDAKPVLEAMVKAYEALIAEVDHIERLKAAR